MASNITFLQAVNRVLRRLRESQVTTVSGASNSYVALIGEFVNEAKEEVEAAWKWNSQLTEFEITIVSGTSEYSLTDFGQEFKIEQVFDTSNNYYLQGPFTSAEMQAATELASDTASSSYMWALWGVDSSGDPKIKFYPTPNDATTIKVLARIKQGYLENDSDKIYIPWRPVVLGAYMKAISERGEDGGSLYDEVNQAYEKALADAIGYDANTGQSNKDWTIC